MVRRPGWHRAKLKSCEGVLSQIKAVPSIVRLNSPPEPLADAEPCGLPPKETKNEGPAQMVTGSETIFAAVTIAIVGSLLQDLGSFLYALPNFLRPAKVEPDVTNPPILAMVLNDMQSLGLIDLTPDTDKKPVTERKARHQHMGEKAAA
jgi:hypothetical protein